MSPNTRTALVMAGVVTFMAGLTAASPPLYRTFCSLTGFGGTPLRAERAPGAVAGEVGVRFDANIHPGLPWRFEPEQERVEYLEKKIQRKDEVLAELMAEHIALKKDLGEL